MTGKNERSRKSKKSFFGWRNWKKVVAVLAGVAVFATTYALILPAITLEGDTACGIEEHVHSEEAGCYETVLFCGLEEGEDHTHTDECYTLELVCTQEEHTHTDECYAADDADESDEGGEEYAYSITGTSEDGLYTVTVSYSDEAEIPEDAGLEISLSDEEYDDETLEEILGMIYSDSSTDAEDEEESEDNTDDAEDEDDADDADDDLTAVSASSEGSDDEDSSDEASEDEDASEETEKTSSASLISSVSLNISIVSEDGEIEPASAVEITITSADTISVNEDEDFSVVSISDEEVTLIKDAALEEDEEAGTSTVTFEAESVSGSEYDLMVTAPGDNDGGGGGDSGGPGKDDDGNDDDDDDDKTVSYYHIDVRINGTINYSTSTTKGETDITVTKEWKDDESTHKSVTVYLLDSSGDKIQASSVTNYSGSTDSSGYIIAVLSEENDWTYTWTDIDLDAGSYSVEEEAVSGYVTTYEDNSVTVTETGEDSSYEYTGTLTVTSLTSVTITDADTDETTTVAMNDTTTEDENSSATTYEYQSTAGHSGDDTSTVLLTEGDTITLVLSFTYSYTDSDENVKSGTIEDFTYTVTVDDDDNVCDGDSGKTDYGFDIVISAEYLLQESGVFNNGTIAITNTKLPDIQIEKVGESGGTVLGGAVFTLSKIKDGTTYCYTTDGDWSSDSNKAKKFDTNGETGLTDVISGLEYGTYYLTEITAPDGYIALTDKVTITVTADGVTAYYGGSQLTVTQDSSDSTLYTITVTNSAGYELPGTGGPGVWWLWTLGILVVGFVLLIAKRESMLKRE